MMSEEFKRRLALLDPQDALWTGIRQLLAANVTLEQQALCAPGLGSEEAHRGRGRLGMLLDLQQQLDDAVQVARREAQRPSGP